MRVLAIALALGGAVWTVALRVGTWGRAPASDFFPATVGLLTLVAAAILPAASIAGDRRLPRLAALRVRPLPRCPFLISKWLACLVLWLALAGRSHRFLHRVLRAMASRAGASLLRAE
jgi:hypothetical protein